jgi:hypothetical protein
VKESVRYKPKEELYLRKNINKWIGQYKSVEEKNRTLSIIQTNAQEGMRG